MCKHPSKLAGIETGANKYIHPNNSNTRHVTDAEKTKWNNSARCVYYGEMTSGPSMIKYCGEITCSVRKLGLGSFEIRHNLGHQNYVIIPFSGSPKCAVTLSSRSINNANLYTYTVGSFTLTDDFPHILIISFE